jgi:tetratricopeptide (TPR) repeat protein
MRVDIIESMPDLQRVRENWNAVYDLDPDAHFFLSWNWLASYLDSLDTPWLVLAARPAQAAPYVGFFPLQLRTREREDRGELYNQIVMGGSYWADYTGFVCAPETQHATISAFAEQVKKLNWTYMMLDNIRASDDRLNRFLEHFPKNKFAIRAVERINRPDNIDNCICPCVTLPDTWEEYVASLGTNARQKARRFLRQLENSPNLRITTATAETVERDLEIVLQFWRAKWGGRKGKRIDILVRANRFNLMAAFKSNQLFLPVLWDGDRPLGGHANLIDPYKQSMLFYLGARDESVNNPPPGFLLHAYGLRFAISQGIRTYDFSRGNEAYKYVFNARDVKIRCFEVSTRTKRNLGGKLDKRSLRTLLQQAASLHKSGKPADAARRYRQALLIDSRCVFALSGLGQLVQAQGDHSEAIRLYRSLLEVKPDSAKVWAWLGKAYHARRQYLEAIDCYEEAVQRQQHFPAAHYALSLALMKIGDEQGAFAAMGAALDQLPRFEAAQEQWLKWVDSLAQAEPSRREELAALCMDRADKSRADNAPDFASRCDRLATALMPAAVVCRSDIVVTV